MDDSDLRNHPAGTEPGFCAVIRNPEPESHWIFQGLGLCLHPPRALVLLNGCLFSGLWEASFWGGCWSFARSGHSLLDCF